MIRYGPLRGLTTKPAPGALRLDRAKPLTRGLLAALFFHEGAGVPTDLLAPRRFAQTGAPTWLSADHGPSLGVTTADYLTSTTADDLQIQPPFSIAVRYRITGSASTAGALWEIGTGCTEWGGLAYSAGNLTFYSVLDGCGANGVNWGDVAIYDGNWHSVVLVAEADRTRRLYFDAVSKLTNTAQTTGWQTGAGATLTVGSGIIGGLDYALQWNRALTPDAVDRLYRDPLGSLLWQPRVRLPTGTIAVQYLRPASDVATGTWTPVPASPTTLYTKLDEATADDADYDYSATYPASDVMTVSLSSATDPTSSTGHVVRYRYRNNNGGGQGTLLVELLQGAATVVASWTHTGITSSSWVQANQTLTGVQADAITDYSTLRLRFTASVG